MLKTLSKFFRVALEGATTDGRNIERDQIIQMARNFNPAKYGARIWLEHIRGVLPEGPFQAYGDVVALKSEEVDIDGIRKMALFAQVEPTPELIAMNRKKQKMYTSIELDPRFADTGEAYLVGLAITDSPASLGTEMLCFAAQKTPEENPFSTRKQRPENLFSEAIEVELEFEEVQNSREETSDESRFSDIHAATSLLLSHIENQSEKLEQASDRMDEMQKQLQAQESAFSALKQQLDNEQTQTDRPIATGSAGELQTDC